VFALIPLSGDLLVLALSLIVERLTSTQPHLFGATAFDVEALYVGDEVRHVPALIGWHDVGATHPDVHWVCDLALGDLLE
jgi:hypothetical protein